MILVGIEDEIGIEWEETATSTKFENNGKRRS